MMFSSSLFSLGLILPLLLLFVGHVAIGLLISGVAIVVRLKADSKLMVEKSQRKIDWAIAILTASVISSVLGASLVHIESEIGVAIGLVVVGWFLLWPASALLTICGKGVGRLQLLFGHGLIALLMVSLLLAVWNHRLQ
jgi:hypothetical protein